mgnify:CR=1 FL=1|jgi:hypothetical protein
MQYFRRGEENSNTVVGIIFLVTLIVFISPNIFPTLLARTFEFIDEGVPCTNLRRAENRSQHQSLIGRASVNPLVLRVQPGRLPNTIDGSLIIRIIVENATIGTVPIVFDERQIIVGDDPASSGFGLIFTPPNAMQTSGVRTTQGGNIPETLVRLLGPRQRCVHRLVIPYQSIDQVLYQGNTAVQAYYRINTPGALPPGSLYPDQGLDILTNNFMISDAVQIPAITANASQ